MVADRLARAREIRLLRETSGIETSMHPGGWGDRVVFGYMFRVIVAVAAVIVPGILLMCWGYLNSWQLTRSMLIFYAAVASVMTFFGEGLRLGVYERRIKAHTGVPARERLDKAITLDDIRRIGRAKLSYRIAKRLFDLAFAITSLVLLFPILIIIALMVRFDSRGPVLFMQPRLGRGNSHFYLYKFRTMYEELPYSESSRVTLAGHFLRRTSLDELPQLINILAGDMSVVGPRPRTLAYFTDKELGSERTNIHKSDGQAVARGTEQAELVTLELLQYMKPGLTGIAAYDGGEGAILRYMENRSLFIDLRIILATFRVLFVRRVD